MPNELISIVIPVYNGERHLKETLQSIVDQNYESLEVIAVDDASTDNSLDVLDQHPLPVKILKRAQNGGPPTARNQGIKEAKGEFVILLDQDDLLAEGMIQAAMTEFELDPSLEMVLGRVKLFGEKADQVKADKLNEPSTGANLGAALIRREVFEKIGLQDEMYIYAHDIDWLNKAKENGTKIKSIDREALFFRLHKNNIDKYQYDNIPNLGLLSTIRGSLQRRRAAGKMNLKKLSDYGES